MKPKPNLGARLGDFVVRRPWISMSLPLVLLAGAASGLPRVGIDSDHRVHFAEDNSHLLAMEAFEAKYSKDENVTVVVHHPEKKVFSNEVLESVQQLTQALWAIEYVTRVDSVTNYQHTRVSEDDLHVGALIGLDALPLSSEALVAKERIALGEPLLSGLALSHDGRATQINATVLMPPMEEDQSAPLGVYRAVEALIADQKVKHPEIEYRINGTIAVSATFATVPEMESQRIMPLMLGIIVLCLGFLVRSVRAVVLPLLASVLVIVFTAGLSGLFGIWLNAVSATFPQIMMTVAIAYTVHVVVSYARLRRAGQSKEGALRATLEENLKPIFLTAVTTALGFFALLLNDTPSLQHLGLFVGVGVLFTFVVAVTFVPAVLRVTPCWIRPTATSQARWPDRISGFAVQHHGMLFAGLIALVFLAAIYIPELEMDNNYVNYFEPGTAFRDDTDWINENLTGVVYTDYSMESGAEHGITDPAFLARVERFTRYLETIPEVRHVSSIIPIMKRLNRNLNGDDPAFYRLPNDPDLSAQYLLLYTLSLPRGLDLQRQINVDYSSTRVSVTMSNTNAKRHREILAGIDAWVAKNDPGLTKGGVGTWVMFQYMSELVARGAVSSLFVALLLITAVCVFALRSWRLGLLSIVPNALPIVLTFGVWAAIGEHVGFSVGVVAGAALGVIVDDTVHLFVRFQRLSRAGESATAAYRKAFAEVGPALLFTSIILVFGFGLFLLSTFRVNITMGVMISVAVAIALIYDFFMVPGLLIWFGVSRKARAEDSIAMAEPLRGLES